MSVSPSQLATNLKDAYRVCDVKPLEGDQIEHYYVPFESRRDTIIDIGTILQDQEFGDTNCFLFTGHVGCGKSSELARLALKWQKDYQVIYVRADEEADINDIQYTDLYLLIIQQVEKALRQQGVLLDARLLKNVEEWFLEITEENETTINRSVSITGEASVGSEVPLLAKFLVKVIAQIKGGATQKKTIRETLKQEFSRLQTDTNLILTNGTQKLREQFPTKKGLLIILDGLDKCPPDQAKHLFLDYATQLLDLNCTVIYTVPIDRAYLPGAIGGTFEKPWVVPMINVYRFEREPLELNYDPTGLEQMASMVEKRVDSIAVFEARQQLLDLAAASGGHLRHMMQMMRDACNNARGKGYAKIQAENVRHAIQQKQFQFERATLRSYYPELAQIAKTKDITDDTIGQELLFSNAALEYNNGDRWVYPHPTVRQSELFKRAIRELGDES